MTLAFDSEIAYELSRWLQNIKGIDIKERTKQLMQIHKPFIDMVKNKKSAEDIAKSLYAYEYNLRRYGTDETCIRD